MTVFCSHAAEMYYCFFPVNEEGEERRRRKNRRCRRWKTRMRRRSRLQLQCHHPQQCSRVVLVGQGNCFFPVHKDGEKEKEEEDEITIMQSYAAVKHDCT